jgi:hypothetical protein
MVGALVTFVLSGCAGSTAGPGSTATGQESAAAGPGHSSAAASTESPNLPDRLDNFMPIGQTSVGSATARATLSVRDVSYEREVAGRVGRAYGASAAAKRYVDARLESTLLVIAVRASSPGLFDTSMSAQALGLTRPLEEVRSFGPVSCLVRNDVVAAGQASASVPVHVERCQRTSAALTVLAEASGPLGDSPEQAAALINRAWTAIGGPPA